MSRCLKIHSRIFLVGTKFRGMDFPLTCSPSLVRFWSNDVTEVFLALFKPGYTRIRLLRFSQISCQVIVCKKKISKWISKLDGDLDTHLTCHKVNRCTLQNTKSQTVITAKSGKTQFRAVIFSNVITIYNYIVACQRGGVSNKPPWAPGSDKTRGQGHLTHFLLRQGEPGMSQYISNPIHIGPNSNPCQLWKMKEKIFSDRNVTFFIIPYWEKHTFWHITQIQSHDQKSTHSTELFRTVFLPSIQSTPRLQTVLFDMSKTIDKITTNALYLATKPSFYIDTPEAANNKMVRQLDYCWDGKFDLEIWD